MGGEPDRQATSTRQWRAAARAGGDLAAGRGVSVSQCFVASCGQAVVDGNTGDGRSGQTSDAGPHESQPGVEESRDAIAAGRPGSGPRWA